LAHFGEVVLAQRVRLSEKEAMHRLSVSPLGLLRLYPLDVLTMCHQIRDLLAEKFFSASKSLLG
jgi:hypothetical protein